MKSTAAAAVRRARGLAWTQEEPFAQKPLGLRRASLADLDELLRLERVCFEDWRQDSRRMIRESLGNPRHEVWVLPGFAEDRLVATLVLRWLPAVLRVYSLATDPSRQGQGLGHQLMDFARSRAAQTGVQRIRLEADAQRAALLEWYERQGFERDRFLPDFYAPGRDAWRMIAQVTGEPVIPGLAE